jgi:hypothetical protein
MKYDKYYVEASRSFLKFEFYSEGPKGKIKKQVVFKPFENNPTVFNLGFGDVDATGEINDTAITNNQDSQKVLATVALTVYKFYEKHSNCYVFATGSTKTRTRLYRMGVANNLEEIRNDFEVFGFIRKSWEPFEKGRDYEAFLIKKKR